MVKLQEAENQIVIDYDASRPNDSDVFRTIALGLKPSGPSAAGPRAPTSRRPPHRVAQRVALTTISNRMLARAGSTHVP